QVAKAYGAGKVMAVDVEEAPLKVAEKLGADLVVNAISEDPVEAAKQFSPGEKYDEGVDLVLNTVGGDTTVEGLRMLRRGGKELLFAGLLGKIRDFDLMTLGGERELTSTANNQPEDYPIGVKLMAEGKVRAKPFITHVFSLDEYEKAFEVALNKGKYGAIKVVMRP
ncbi:MAG: zinc-binding dehydrogenase, partial [Thermoprotei archaeon]